LKTENNEINNSNINNLQLNDRRINNIQILKNYEIEKNNKIYNLHNKLNKKISDSLNASKDIIFFENSKSIIHKNKNQLNKIFKNSNKTNFDNGFISKIINLNETSFNNKTLNILESNIQLEKIEDTLKNLISIINSKTEYFPFQTKNTLKNIINSLQNNISIGTVFKENPNLVKNNQSTFQLLQDSTNKNNQKPNSENENENEFLNKKPLDPINKTYLWTKINSISTSDSEPKKSHLSSNKHATFNRINKNKHRELSKEKTNKSFLNNNFINNEKGYSIKNSHKYKLKENIKRHKFLKSNLLDIVNFLKKVYDNLRMVKIKNQEYHNVQPFKKSGEFSEKIHNRKYKLKDKLNRRYLKFIKKIKDQDIFKL